MLSMGGTEAALIDKATRNNRAVQPLPGHPKIESTVRYSGGEIDDALEVAKTREVFVCRGLGALRPLSAQISRLAALWP